MQSKHVSVAIDHQINWSPMKNAAYNNMLDSVTCDDCCHSCVW